MPTPKVLILTGDAAESLEVIREHSSVSGRPNEENWAFGWAVFFLS